MISARDSMITTTPSQRNNWYFISRITFSNFKVDSQELLTQQRGYLSFLRRHNFDKDAVFSALKKKAVYVLAWWLKQLAVKEFPIVVYDFFRSPTCLAGPRFKAMKPTLLTSKITSLYQLSPTTMGWTQGTKPDRFCARKEGGSWGPRPRGISRSRREAARAPAWPITTTTTPWRLLLPIVPHLVQRPPGPCLHWPSTTSNRSPRKR